MKNKQKPEHCLSKLKCNASFCSKCVYNKNIMKHLREDIKESKLSIKKDKKTMKILGKLK